MLEVDVKGMTGKRMAIKSVPYSAIRSFTITTNGHFDRDCELSMVIDGHKPFEKDFNKHADIKGIMKVLAERTAPGH